MQNRNSEQSTQLYLEIKNEGVLYKVLENQYQLKRLAVDVSCIINIQVVITCLILVIIEIPYNSTADRANFLPLFIQGTVFLLALLLLMVVNRQHTSLYSLFSVSIALIYLLTSTILYCKQIPFQWLTALIFIISQIAVGATLFDNKKYILLVAILGLQLILITLKTESKIDSTWLVVLIITVGTIISCITVGLAFIFFSIAQKIKEYGARFLAVETLYIGLSQIGYSLTATLIFMKIQFGTPTIIIAIPCAIYHFFIVIFTSYFKTEIVLFQADATVVRKSQRRQYRVSLQKIEEENRLQQISSNFFTLKDIDAPKSKPVSILDVLQQPHGAQNLCIVCLTDRTCLVWMPCGHLAVCDSCGKYLMESDKLDCIICKTKCQVIYHITNEPLAVDKREIRSDYCYKINNN